MEKIKWPEGQTLFSETGCAYELKKNFKKAIRHYKKALEHTAESRSCFALEQRIERCKRKKKK